VVCSSADAQLICGVLAAPTGRSRARRPEAAAWRWDASADAQWAYGAFFGLLALGQLPAAQAQRLADLPYFVGLATLTIYIGAHRGLSSRSRQQISLRQARRGRPPC